MFIIEIIDDNTLITDFIVTGLFETNKYEFIRFLEHRVNLFDKQIFTNSEDSSSLITLIIPNRMYNDSTKKKIRQYLQIKNIYSECLKRIKFHPALERTISENLVKFNEMENDN